MSPVTSPSLGSPPAQYLAAQTRAMILRPVMIGGMKGGDQTDETNLEISLTKMKTFSVSNISVRWICSGLDWATLLSAWEDWENWACLMFTIITTNISTPTSPCPHTDPTPLMGGRLHQPSRPLVTPFQTVFTSTQQLLRLPALPT